MALAPGTRLGTFEILGPLGAGGMGEVYQARDTRLGRDVAIKVLPEAFARDSERAARFEREARLLASINHPAIAAIYGAEASGSLQYIVMELVPGETLGEKLARGPLPLEESLLLSRQIAEALEAAHEKGVVHRDLKPSNIKVTPEGKVKVLDLGLAKAMEPPPSEDISKSPTMVAEQTRPGVILGTVEFMSPEQARGKPIDKRTDIWAFGCILFEMLSGERAFSGETVSDILAAILAREPDWSALPGRTPERIRELLHKCLEKDPGRRLRDAGDARLELEAALAGMSGAGVIAAAGRVTPWKMVAAVAAGAVLAVTAYLVVRPRARGPETAGTRQLAVLPFRNLTGNPEGELMGLGLAETVSVRLANVPGLQVVTPRATVEAVEQDPSFARVARRLGANTLLAGTLQREKEHFRITYRLLDAGGNQIAANAIDGLELFGLQDRVADGVVRDLRLRRAARRTPTPSGLENTTEQERYLQAIGLLQRYDKRDGIEQAVEILRKLSEEKPNSALVQAALGRVSLAMFDFTMDRSWADRAIAAADAARALDSGIPEVDVTLGETLLATGRAKEAAEAFRRALAARPGDVEALLGLGRASEAAGDNAAAEAAFRRSAVLQPSFAVFNQVGGFYYRSGRFAESAEMFRRATRFAPDSYRAFSNLGGAETMRCKYAAAIEAFRQALELQPKDPNAASNLGLTQLWMGRTAEAVASLEGAARYGPNDYLVWGNLGDAYRATPNRSGKAAEAYERSTALAREQLRLNPQDPEARSMLATNLAKTGHPAEAGAEIQKALAIDDKEPAILADAAVVAALAGRDGEALDWLRKAVLAGYCREIIARQPEFARFREGPDFRSIVAAPRNAAGS